MRKALAGLLVGGALAGCGSSHHHASSVRPVKAKTTASGRQRTFSAAGMAVHFNFPASFTLRIASSRRIAGNTARAIEASIGVSDYDLLIVSLFPKRPIPVTARNIAKLKPQFDQAVSVALGHKVRSSVGEVGGLPALLYPAAPVAGLPVKAMSRITEVFVDDDEYELNCQYTRAHAKTITSACNEMLQTLSAST